MLILLALALMGACGSSRKAADGTFSSSGGSGGDGSEPVDTVPSDDAGSDAAVDDRESAGPFDLAAPSDGDDGMEVTDTPDANHASEMDHDACRGSCEITASVGCAAGSPACVATCETVLMDNPCAAELRAFLLCQTALGPTAFACVPDVGPTLMPGVCLAERAARTACRADAG